MKFVNKIIRKTMIEIALVIGLVIISYPICNNTDLSEYSLIAGNFNQMTFTMMEITGLDSYTVYPMSTEKALENINPINIKLINDTNTKEEYELWLVISKESTLNYQQLMLNFEDKTNKLSDYYITDDENNYYFLIEEGSLVATTLTKNLRIWLNENSTIEDANKQLIFHIENVTRQDI